jgi:hypothetical protein
MANGNPPVQLDADTQQLAPGGQGWITLEEARALFSSLEAGDISALTEFDAEGVLRLGAFAGNCHCSARKVGDQVIFTRN